MRLKVNPILRASHLKYYFNVSEKTAYKILNTMKDALGRNIVTFQDFYNQFESYPDPQFKPKYI